ncbi:PA14 domain-containing protein [Spirosoma sp. KNUC1025]|uniref:PA14 domain-containing protein n=1 Tax=Spirosoma sp. KNUC1025 TaxID=2894082 RepID=UPI00386F3BC8|nr:T9SS type A sorting domain-containing protein [Spirosoma sp. KNUC1025]
MVVSPKAEGATTQLYPDGSLRRTYRTAVGQAQKFTRKPLTGFDGANNPLWGSETTLATTPLTTSDDPLYYGNQIKLRAGEVTASNVVVAFDGSKASTKYHLGGIRLSDNKWLWRTAVNTHWAYTGAYPADGSYDVGNGVNTTGIAQQVNGRVILWGYHGEFWKASQTNKYQLVYDNGLFLGQFGTTRSETDAGGQEVPPAGMAGNAFSGSLVKVGDDLYYYHNDENYHSGIHRWKIAGLNTIQEQVIGVSGLLGNAQASLASQPQGGLTGYYFNGSDVNNLLLKSSRVDGPLNFSWGSAVPAGSGLSDAASYSVRWKGFLQASYSEAYTLSVQTDRGVRLWVDDSLVIDQWANRSLGEASGVVNLKAGQYVALRLESQGGSRLVFNWSSAHQPKGVVPASALFPNTDSEEAIGKDLLYGLQVDKVLNNGLYGWKREPAVEDYTDANKDWWQVVSGRKSYRKQSADLWVKFRQVSGSYAITRDLGVVSNASSWSLTGRISYEGNEGNNSVGGCYLEVLDKAGKVIARTYITTSYSGTRPIAIFGNTMQIATGAQYDMRRITDQVQPLSIIASSTGITFNYANYKSVSTKVFDASSDWRAPKTLRLYFSDNGTGGNTYNRIIDIESMQFGVVSKARMAISSIDVPEPKLRLYPNPSQDILTVEHATITNEGSLIIYSIDGRRLQRHELLLGSSQTTLDVSMLPKGVYVLEYIDSSTKRPTRFIKQ